MNRKLNIVFTAAILLFAACTKHPINPTPQVPDSSHSYIFFEPEVMETVATRNTSTTTKHLSQISSTEAFGVLGYYGTTQLFKPNATSTGIAQVSPADGVYSYSPLETWRSKDGVHTFYAFFPYSSLVNHVSLETAEGDYEGKPFVAYDIDDNVDVLVDELTTAKGNGTVTFELAHALYALDVQVTNAQTTNIYEPDPDATTPRDPKLYITGAKLTLYNLKESGKIYLDGSVVADNTVTESKEYTLFEATTDVPRIQIPHTTTDNANVYVFDQILLLPVTNSTFSYKLEMTFENAWNVAYPVTFEGNVPDKTFEAGKRYKLAIKKNDGADFTISADLPVAAWNQVTIPHTFN